jgi:sugar lactone lactonase YvrE
MTSRLFLLLFLTLTLGAQAFVQAHPAWGIVVERGGHVVFSDLETIWRVDARGRLSVVRAGVSGRHVHEITLDEAGNLYGADLAYHAPRWQSAVWRITPTGEFAYLLAPTYEPPRGLSLIRDRAGNAYFVEADAQRRPLLLRRAPDGRISTVAGGAAGFADGRGQAAGFDGIGRMTVQPDGTIHLLDDGALRRVSPAGEVSTLARGLDKYRLEDTHGERGYGGLMGLCVDARGEVFVADYSTRRVLKVARDGATSTVMRAEPPWSPSGVAAGPAGELYVLEIGFEPPRTYSGPRVRRLGTDGRNDVLVEIGRRERESHERAKPPSGNDGSTTQPEAQRGDAPDEARAADALRARNESHARTDRLVKLSLVFLGVGLLAASALARYGR